MSQSFTLKISVPGGEVITVGAHPQQADDLRAAGNTLQRQLDSVDLQGEPLKGLLVASLEVVCDQQQRIAELEGQLRAAKAAKERAEKAAPPAPAGRPGETRGYGASSGPEKTGGPKQRAAFLDPSDSALDMRLDRIKQLLLKSRAAA